MTTPADWYPDPENAGQLRYWDGSGWTEHRAPAPTAAPAEAPTAAPAEAPAVEPAAEPDPFPASEQATTVVPVLVDPVPGAESELPAGGGSHRAPDPQADPSYDPAPTPQYEPPPITSSYDPPPGASYGAPAPGPTWGNAPAGQPYETSQFAPPPGPPGPPAPPTGPSGGSPNKKLIIGILSGAAALILIVALALVYVFVIRDDNTTVTASSSSSSSSSSKTKTTSSKTSPTKSTTSATESPTRDPAGPVTDGNLTFTITDIEAAESITSTFSDQVGKTAQGTYAIVHLTVGNVGVDPVTFLATFQRLNGSGQSLAPDDEATVFAGGGYADVPPGGQVDTIVVFDVPDDVEPASMFFQQDPVTPGVELPF